MVGSDPDHATRDLFNTIARGEFPSWTAYVQIMRPEEAEQYRFNPFDITKVWPHADYPLIEVGKMVLDRNPENYHEDVEQAAFSPGNFVPGIAASPDKMLQGRIFSYHDTHRHRLSGAYHQLPVNKSRARPVNNYQRDGFMRFDGNGGGRPNYWPNSFEATAPDPRVAPPAIDVAGLAQRYDVPLGDVDFVQAGALYGKVMSEQDRENLVGNIVGHLGNAQRRIQYRQAAIFYKCHADYGTRVAVGLGLDVDKVEALAAMTQQERVLATAQGTALDAQSAAVPA
jgi:catalase